ncbi:MAG: hypothetical protein NT157_02615 [Candidatus Micrarchaeota archaeon]|nr:hypothetical protein [Candidatus Micrarchaeota archaeon]
MNKLNEDFKRTCRIIFGEEVGELEEFAPYLKETMFPYKLEPSSVSGKQVVVSSPYYLDGAAYVSQDEVARLKFEPFNINEIKDIDSLLEAASERAVYCGNKIFGKNMNVMEVDNCTDCIEVMHSHDVTNTKYAAFCSNGRNSDSIYGVSGFWNCSNSIRCVQCSVRGAIRSFECYCSAGISDSYYTINCSGCTNCMFCFNLRSKNYLIGNLQLAKDRYGGIKEKLVSEMAERLRRDKRLFSIVDVLLKAKGASTKKEVVIQEEEPPDFIKRDFADATKVVLGAEHKLSRKTGEWLSEKATAIKCVVGASGSPAYKVDLPLLRVLPASKLVSLSEALDSAQKQQISISPREVPSLDEVVRRVAEKATCTLELVEGQTQNNPDTVFIVDSVDTYRSWWTTRAKRSAFNSIVTESEYIFGGYMRILYCGFCINCHSVTSVKNCFETDSSYKCRNCYFCHNCENVEEGLFCFNAKGLRYAVCNQQFPPEQYKRVKKILLDYINGELEKKGRLDIDVFGIGAMRKKK